MQSGSRKRGFKVLSSLRQGSSSNKAEEQKSETASGEVETLATPATLVPGGDDEPFSPKAVTRAGGAGGDAAPADNTANPKKGAGKSFHLPKLSFGRVPSSKHLQETVHRLTEQNEQQQSDICLLQEQDQHNKQQLAALQEQVQSFPPSDGRPSRGCSP